MVAVVVVCQVSLELEPEQMCDFPGFIQLHEQLLLGLGSTIQDEFRSATIIENPG